MRSIILLATLAMACTTSQRSSPAPPPATPTPNIAPAVEAPDAEASAAGVRESVNATFLKLLDRDGLHEQYERYSNKASGICIDWDTYERVNSSELLRIEHYWYEYDEGTPAEMARSILTKCDEWRRKEKAACQCQTLALNGIVALDVPNRVVEKTQRADSATQLIKSAAFRQRLVELDQMVTRTGYLSDDTTSPYWVIREHQASQCAKYGNRSAGCQQTEADCMADDMGLGGDDEKTDAVVRALACKKISTPHETPGSYLMLKRMELLLLAALQLDGYPSSYSLALGTTPAPQINVTVFTEKIADAHIVLFNERYFSFAYEMAKVAALSLPLKEERGLIAYKWGDDELLQFLEEHPEIEHTFRETVLTFAGRANREQLIPAKIHRPLLLSFTKGIETFALAHEIGHIVLHQTTKPASPTASLNDEACTPLSGGGAWLEEIEADYFAMRLMSRVRDIISACGGYVNHKRQGLLMVGTSQVDCDSHPMDLAYPLTPAFYFLAKEILEESCKSGGAPVVAQEAAAEQQVIAFASSCAQDDTCDFLRDVRRHLPPEVLVRRGHPSARTRRALAETWQPHSDLKGFDSPVSSLANSLLRNSQIIWNRVKLTMEDAQ